MKRPLLYAAVMIICGLALGIKETAPVIRLTSFMAALGVLITALDKRNIIAESSEPSLNILPDCKTLKKLFNRNRFTIALTLVLFFLSLFRGAYISNKYNSKACIQFFESYTATNPGQFDYSMYLKSKGIDSLEKYEKYRDSGSDFDENSEYSQSGAGLPNQIRANLEKILDENLIKKDAGMYKAILLGNKENIEEETFNLYQKSGISHLLAISGTHFGVIALGIMTVLKKLFRLKNNAACVITSVMLIGYLFICGAPVSAIRAVTMIIAGFAAGIFGRSYCIKSALSLAAAFVAFIYPYQIFNSGFQLSFGAIIAICYANDCVIKCVERIKSNETGRKKARFCKRIKKEDRLNKALKAFIMSAVIQLLLLPIIAWNYFVFPPYGIILNLIVIPLMAIIIYSGLLVLIFGALAGLVKAVNLSIAAGILNFTTFIAAAPGHYLLEFYEKLCTLAGRLPYSSVCTGRPSFTSIIIYYLLVAVIVYTADPLHWPGISAAFKIICSWCCEKLKGLIGIGNKIAIKKLLRILDAMRIRLKFINHRSLIAKFDYARSGIVILVLLLTAASSLIGYREADNFYITALDVGQGDGFYIRAGGKNILIDGGSSSNKKLGERVLKPFLLSKRITDIDIALVSHIDNDHVSGLKYLLEDEDIDISLLALPRAAKKDKKYNALKMLIDSKDIIYMEDGMEFFNSHASDSREKKIELICIYSGNDYRSEAEDRNRQSDILLLKKDMFSMLFTGDASSEDDEIIKEKFISYTGTDEVICKKGITVLKAAHHGSKTASSDSFLDAVKPEYVVLSYGRNNRYGHPSDLVMERMSKKGILDVSTCEYGALYIDESGISGFKQKK